MCLTKKRLQKPKITDKDIYLIKHHYEGVYEKVFVSDIISFCYLRNQLYKKSWWHQFKAFFRTELEGEVFHTFNLKLSKSIAQSFGSKDTMNYGIFIIPKGTPYYEGHSSDLGCFSIQYHEPLTEENKNLILNQ